MVIEEDIIISTFEALLIRYKPISRLFRPKWISQLKLTAIIVKLIFCLAMSDESE